MWLKILLAIHTLLFGINVGILIHNIKFFKKRKEIKEEEQNKDPLLEALLTSIFNNPNQSQQPIQVQSFQPSGLTAEDKRQMEMKLRENLKKDKEKAKKEEEERKKAQEKLLKKFKKGNK